MTDFDLTSAIADFLADASLTSLELPHMTTGQRKKTKLLVDKYAELRCESFGFGAERRLHLFKSEADAAVQMAAPSMTCSEQDPSIIINSECCRGAIERADSPECSTQASADMSDVSYSVDASPQSSGREKEAESMHAMHVMNVRNTFIHMETASKDERAVQSMPHGMFGKCMLAEMAQSNRADETFVEEETQSNAAVAGSDFDGEAASSKEVDFSVGTLVIVEGLVKAPMFNGRTAVVEGWDQATERYRILIGSTGGWQQAKVKRENLKLVLQCP